jgi:hypothetical protein
MKRKQIIINSCFNALSRNDAALFAKIQQNGILAGLFNPEATGPLRDERAQNAAKREGGLQTADSCIGVAFGLVCLSAVGG